MYTIYCIIKNKYDEAESARVIESTNKAIATRKANKWFRGAFINTNSDAVKKEVNYYDKSIETWEYKSQ